MLRSTLYLLPEFLLKLAAAAFGCKGLRDFKDFKDTKETEDIGDPKKTGTGAGSN